MSILIVAVIVGVIALLLGMAIGAFIVHKGSAELKTYLEKLLAGMEQRIRDDISLILSGVFAQKANTVASADTPPDHRGGH